MVMACCIPGILFSAPVLSPVKSPAKYKTDTIEQSPPVLTYKQLHEQWEQLVGDTAKSDSESTANPLKKDSLLSNRADPSDKTSKADSSKRKVLLLTGDSMIGCLSWYLERNCSLLGYEMQVSLLYVRQRNIGQKANSYRGSYTSIIRISSFYVSGATSFSWGRKKSRNAGDILLRF